METVHASAVAVRDRAALIFGAPGSGKSGLALTLIALGARLVTDDRAVLTADTGALRVAPPPTLTGLVEARGVGVLTLPYNSYANVRIVVDLDIPADGRVPRKTTRSVEGIDLPLIPGANVPNLAQIVLILLRDEGAAITDPEACPTTATSPAKTRQT